MNKNIGIQMVTKQNKEYRHTSSTVIQYKILRTLQVRRKGNFEFHYQLKDSRIYQRKEIKTIATN